ncbi:hypothetical protein K438DRAFT_2086950 [Mycena galopus ATCC 62051]|nr:hypothetical protein K438DRAFT_2086950 [Mycena galopus ATCC 62051]
MTYYSALPTTPRNQFYLNNLHSGSQSTLRSAHQKASRRPLHLSGTQELTAKINKRLLFLGIVSLLWGLGLMVLALGFVPIAWSISQVGQKNLAMVNVIINGVSTLSTAQLVLTIAEAAKHYTQIGLHDGMHLRKWHRMQKFAATSFFPPGTWHAVLIWLPWVLAFSLLVANGMSVTAILQPVPYYQHVLFNDSIPCGIDPADLSFSSNLTIQPALDEVSFQIGLQLGNYYDQVGGDVTTAVAGRTYAKDNFGYGAIGGLVSGLQEMPGVEIDTQCGNDTSLWANLLEFPFPNINITNGIGDFSGPVVSSSTRSVITTGPFNLTGSHVALYGVVSTAGTGGLITVDRDGNKTVCTWTATPRSVNITMANFTASTLGAINATVVPSPTSCAISSVVRGMAAAIQLGAHLTWDFPIGGPAGASGQYPNTGSTNIPNMLKTLIADGVKASLTAYTQHWQDLEHGGKDPVAALGESVTGGRCGSNNRTLSMHWRFGIDNWYLGLISIGQAVGFGALSVYIALLRQKRFAEIDPFDVVEVFKLGVASPALSGVLHNNSQLLQVSNGIVVPTSIKLRRHIYTASILGFLTAALIVVVTLFSAMYGCHSADGGGCIMLFLHQSPVEGVRVELDVFLILTLPTYVLPWFLIPLNAPLPPLPPLAPKSAAPNKGKVPPPGVTLPPPIFFPDFIGSIFGWVDIPEMPGDWQISLNQIVLENLGGALTVNKKLHLTGNYFLKCVPPAFNVQNHVDGLKGFQTSFKFLHNEYGGRLNRSSHWDMNEP